MGFPVDRLRRLRRSETMRRMVRETALAPDDFVYPMFVVPGKGLRREISAMPGQYQLSVDQFLRELEDVASLRIPAVILFGVPEVKDAAGSSAYSDEGVVQQAIRAAKREFPQVVVITDVCLCEYTSHGHCGILRGEEVDNDPTLVVLAREAVSHARAGADMVAPSDMMDGRVGAIRQALDAEGFSHLPVMAYSAKYASGFYGPFREAAESTPQFGDRQGYQMDPANAREALQEVALDIAEGADIVMVKPALSYLDVITRVHALTPKPLAAYNVSGEYAMVKAAARAGWIDERRVTMEILTSIKRAGADLILTYHAREACRWLSEA